MSPASHQDLISSVTLISFDGFCNMDSAFLVNDFHRLCAYNTSNPSTVSGISARSSLLAGGFEFSAPAKRSSTGIFKKSSTSASEDGASTVIRGGDGRGAGGVAGAGEGTFRASGNNDPDVEPEAGEARNDCDRVLSAYPKNGAAGGGACPNGLDCCCRTCWCEGYCWLARGCAGGGRDLLNCDDVGLCEVSDEWRDSLGADDAFSGLPNRFS